MNLISRSSLTAAALLAALTAATSHAKQTDTSYTVRIDPGSRVLKVDAELTLEDDRLYVAEIGASQFEDRWAKFIKNLKVSRFNGSDVDAAPDGRGNWKLAAKEGERVRFSYVVDLKHEDHEWPAGIDGAAYVRDWGIFSVGRAFAVMNGGGNGRISLKFEVPEGWKVSGSWRDLGNGRFLANGNRDISESMFFAGTHKEFSVTRDGFDLVFAIGGPGVIEQEKQFASLARGVLDYYIDLMGSVPKPPPGTDLGRVLVVISPGKTTDGEVIGNQISMILDTGGDPMSQMISKFIFAHEFFHLWNGKSMIPASNSEEWFKEGVSNYYTMKALRKAGVLGEDEIFSFMNGLFFQRYSNDEGYGKKAISEVSSGDDKHKHWGMIYGGGMFAGICQDIAIRKATKNKKSLDDLIVGLFSRFGGTSKEYSREDLVNAASDLAGRDQSGFFDSYLYGPAPVPIDLCLRDAGLSAKVENGQLVIGRKKDESAEEKESIKGILGN